MTNPREQSAFVRACRGEPTDHTPIWLNRQAGRYMPEYHALKGDTPSLAFFTNPELAAQAAIDAQRILGVDAAIMFADLLPMLVPMGLDLDYAPGTGPVFANPVRTGADIEALRVVPAQEGTGYIAETIRNTLSGLPRDIPLIGFAGAPFTLASYAAEGRSSRNYVHTKKLMYEGEAIWRTLMGKLTETIIDYVRLQIDSGVQAVQIFDSWIGALSRPDFERYVAPFVTTLMEGITGRVPIIYFGTGNSHLIDEMFDCGPDLMALDWRTPLEETWAGLDSPSIQGNMDPIVLCTEPKIIADAARNVLDEAQSAKEFWVEIDEHEHPGHIFNLGHGIIPETPVDHVKFLVDFVHEQTMG